MPSLRQILDTHDDVLVLDAASARIQVGRLQRNRPPQWAASIQEAGVGVFECANALGVDPQIVKAFIFCDGPGSILGIRTTAMAIRSWNVLMPRPVFTYCSLGLVAETLDPTIGVIADARRDSWHLFQRGGHLRRAAATDLPGTLAMPEGFRHWSPLPPGVRTVPYPLAELMPKAAEADLFQATDAPDAFLHEEPRYVTWTPQIHRAPL